MSLKDHPQFSRVMGEVNSGQLSISAGASELGVPYKTFWNHVQSHIELSSAMKGEDNDIVSLRDLVRKVKEKTMSMLEKFDEVDKRIIPSYVREVRQLIVDINRIALNQLGSPKIIIQNFMNQQVEMQTFLLEELCPEDKAKLLDYLEQSHDNEIQVKP